MWSGRCAPREVRGCDRGKETVEGNIGPEDGEEGWEVGKMDGGVGDEAFGQC